MDKLPENKTRRILTEKICIGNLPERKKLSKSKYDTK